MGQLIIFAVGEGGGKGAEKREKGKEKRRGNWAKGQSENYKKKMILTLQFWFFKFNILNPPNQSKCPFSTSKIDF